MWVEHCLRATSLPPFPFFVCVVFKLYILQDCYRYFGDESDFKEKILVCWIKCQFIAFNKQYKASLYRKLRNVALLILLNNMNKQNENVIA